MKHKGLSRELIVQVGGWASLTEQEANTHLIAAAPDLLEAAKEFLEPSYHPGEHRFDSWHDQEDGDFFITCSLCETDGLRRKNALEAAIAKAEGKLAGSTKGPITTQLHESL